MKGKVKWFNSKFGYGFIQTNELPNDIFIHFKEIKIPGYKTLNEGDLVKFDYNEELKKAENLKIIKKVKKLCSDH